MSENSMSLLGKIAAYTEILSKDPQSTVFVSLCEAYRQLGMLDDALEIAEKGTLRLPGFSPGFTALGRIYSQRGDLIEASQAFERALAIEEDNGLALKGLSRVKYRQGDSRKARELLHQVLRQNPEDAIAKKMLASLGAAAPFADAGSKVPVSAVPAQPECVEPSNRKVVDAGSTGKPAPSTTPIPTETVADLYRRQGLLGEAATIYRALLRENPHNETVRQKLIALKKQMDVATSAPGPMPAQPQQDRAVNRTQVMTTEIQQQTVSAAPPGPSAVPTEAEWMPQVPPQDALPAQEDVQAEAPQELSPQEQVLRQLDCWLEAIVQRRAAHVQ